MRLFWLLVLFGLVTGCGGAVEGPTEKSPVYQAPKDTGKPPPGAKDKKTRFS